MNQRVMRARLQILPVITMAVLFLPGAAWAQATAEPKIRIEGPFNSGIVYSVAFSPDGKTLASGSGDNTIRLWDVGAGRLIRSLAGHGGAVRSVAFSPDGKMIASASEDKTIKLWQVSTGKYIRLFNGHTGSVYSVAFSPDGKTLASSSEEGNESALRLWDVNTGRLIRSFEERNQWVPSVAFSPDGKMIASGSHEQVVKLWDVGTGNLIRSFMGHRNTIHSVAFSPDGKTLASGGSATIKVWSIGAKRLLGSLLHYHDGNWIAFIPGNYYVSSEGAAQYISWRFGNKDYDESQFRSRFYQPDIVAAGLSGKEVINLVPSVTTEGDKSNTTGDNSVITGPAKPPIKDTTAPKIVITSPSVTRGVSVQSTAGKITLTGRAIDDSGVKKVLAQGATARLDARGNFSAEVPLEIGDNLITVTATDIYGNQASESFVVRRDPIAGPVTAAASAPGRRYHALLIAVQDYDHPSVNRLDYPVGDAQQVERELTSRYTFEPQNVTTLKNPDRRTILDALDQMTEKLKPEDNLLIFYAGHGQWDEQRKQGYWLPRDATRDRRADWISNSDLRDAIRGIKARHILLISDACFAGGIFQAREAFGPASSAVAELDNLPSRTAMTSGALTTVPDRSVFVEYLLKRLRDNTEERLPALELFSKLRLPVINNSPTQKDGFRPTPRYGTIFEVGDEGGDFIFVRRR